MSALILLSVLAGCAEKDDGTSGSGGSSNTSCGRASDGHDFEQEPQDGSDRILITSVTGTIPWCVVQISSGSAVRFALNGPAGKTSPEIKAYPDGRQYGVFTSTAKMKVGDYVELCAAPGGADQFDYSIWTMAGDMPGGPMHAHAETGQDMAAC